MALAQYLKIDEYFNYYREKLAAGEIVILDNGVYEGELVKDSDLLGLVRSLRPSVVVLPDDPNDWEKSRDMSMNFHNKLVSRHLDHKTEPLYIVHTNGHARVSFENYEFAANLFPWIGFSRLTKSYGISYDTRPIFASVLKVTKRWSPLRMHHALGMKSGSLEELKGLVEQGFFSCDSSAPVWRGLHGLQLINPGWKDVAFDPRGRGREHWAAAEYNLKTVYTLCK